MDKIDFKETTSEGTTINGINLSLLQDKSSFVCEIEQPRPRNNRSTLQFNGDTYYTLYTETKFNKLQKWLWKKLLNIKIEDLEE